MLEEADITCDFETRSDVDLKKHGVDRYFDSPHAKPLIGAWKLNDEPTQVWLPGQPCPPRLARAVANGATFSAHNCNFERQLWNKVLVPRYGWPELRLEQCRCTAATAAALGLPRDLGGLGRALGLPIQKDADGAKLIQFFCVPRRRTALHPELRFNEPEDHPAEFARFIAYCVRDVDTEYAADRRMIPLPEFEQAMWLIDQRINDRGLMIDRESALAALRLADAAKDRLDQDLAMVTGGQVRKASQVAQLTAWANARLDDHDQLPSLGKADLTDALETGNLPDAVRSALDLRLEAAKSSVSKLTAFLARMSPDNRVRNAFLFCAAGTGRWSSLGVQLHNLPRPRKEFGDAHLDLDGLFDAIRRESVEWLGFLYGPVLGRPLHLLADALRSFIVAAPGHELIACDYSNIEGVVAAWIAGEEWKLEAFREIFADDNVADLYRRAAAGIFGTTVDEISKKDPKRQIGKVAELSMQYQGGPGAMASMARNYMMHMEDAFPFVWAAASDERRDRSVTRYLKCVQRNEPTTRSMTREAWIAAEIVKLGWRASNPKIVESWPLLEDAARNAVANPGEVFECLKVSYTYKKGFLWCRLPSGRCLAYATPRLKAQVWACRYLGSRDGEPVWADPEVMEADTANWGAVRGLIRIEGPTKSKVTVLGVDSQTRKFVRYALYGGLCFENVVQAVARDILANGIKIAETAGYPVIGHVHDEIIAEVKHGFGSVKAFCALICKLPPWAWGMPLAATGFRGSRYKKD